MTNNERIPETPGELQDEHSTTEAELGYGGRRPPYVPLTLELIEKFVKIESIKQILLEQLEKRKKQVAQKL